MTLMVIDYSDFIGFCERLTGSEITTAGGRSSFTLLSANSDRIEYKLSTGKIRRNERVRVQRALEIYEQTHSFKTTDYTSSTQAASYLLPLIKLYLESEQGRER